VKAPDSWRVASLSLAVAGEAAASSAKVDHSTAQSRPGAAVREWRGA
jgi:hypothetical protein